jgi:TolB-like protein/class 3 adenylate cyclase/Tfp pilus assembly protein PilF
MPDKQKVTRKLSAILSADVKGYSVLMADDEIHTIETLKAHRKIISGLITEYSGRVVDSPGDNILAEFRSVVDAVKCAAEIQKQIKQENERYADDKKVQFRIGVNIGDVVQDGDRIYGNGVNVAARIEGLADPGGVSISRNAFGQVKDKLKLGYEYQGEHEVKNIKDPIKVYKVLLDPSDAGKLIGGISKPVAKNWTWATIVVAAVVIAVVATFVYQKISKPDFEPAKVEKMAYPLPDKPSIAVLPFDNLSGDPKQEYLSDGISESIITELSRFRELFVIARLSSFSYKGKAVKISQVSEELGVQYVLEGSMQQAGDKLRVTAQLIDATNGRHLWADTYDRKLEDVLTVQDEITRTIAATLEENIALAERERARSKPPHNLKAYEYRQLAHVHRLKLTKEDNERARQMSEKAIELDPNYADAYVGLTWVNINGFRWGWSNTHSREESLQLALETAKKAVELGPFNSSSHWALAHVLMLSGELEQALAKYDQALELNPNSARLLADMAEPLVYTGRAEEAVALMNTAIRLNPRHPGWYWWNLGWAQYFTEQYEEALASLRRWSNPPNGIRRILAPILVRLGRLDEARAEIEEYLKIDPDFSIEHLNVYPWKYKEYFERMSADLRTVGIPDK